MTIFASPSLTRQTYYKEFGPFVLSRQRMVPSDDLAPPAHTVYQLVVHISRRSSLQFLHVRFDKP